MRNRLSTISDFQQHLNLSNEEVSGFKAAVDKLSVSVTPYFFNLINKTDPNCPIRRQVIPLGDESNVYRGNDRPCGEENTMPVTGIVHRYPDRVYFWLLIAVHLIVGIALEVEWFQTLGVMVLVHHNAGLDYIRKNTSIRDVLLSGGDPLLLSDNKLGHLLKSLSEIKHLEFVRIGSRVPVFLPQRINDSLLSALSCHPNLWMSIHVNHPTECTLELKGACEKLVNSGIPLGNQSVL